MEKQAKFCLFDGVLSNSSLKSRFMYQYAQKNSGYDTDLTGICFLLLNAIHLSLV